MDRRDEGRYTVSMVQSPLSVAEANFSACRVQAPIGWRFEGRTGHANVRAGCKGNACYRNLFETVEKSKRKFLISDFGIRSANCGTDRGNLHEPATIAAKALKKPGELL